MRRALFMPALVAVRHEPHRCAFDPRLFEPGKAKTQAVMAVMRKLLHAIFGMFKYRQPFDGSKVYRLSEEAAAGLPTFSAREAA